MKIVIIGGISAGSSAAVRARRNSEDAEIVIYDRDVDITHAGFATHYVVGGVVESIDKLTPITSDWFKQRHNIDVHTSHEVTRVDHDNKTIYGKNLITGEDFEDSYDVLVFATGSSPTVPPVFRGKEFENVFTVKNVQGGRKLKEYIDKHNPKNAVVIGGGYIGLGVSEQLTNIGMKVTTLEFLKYPMAQMDNDTSIHIQHIMENNGVTFHGDDGVVELVTEDGTLEKVITAKGKEYSGDLYILATGVRPNTELSEAIGVELGTSGAIKVNEKMQTNIPDVYAIGDVAEAYHAITKEPLYLPLATTALKMGRIAGDVITGGDLTFNGVLGTSVVRMFNQTIASTGLTERAARDKGYNPIVLNNVKLSRLEFMGGEDILIKAIADPETEELLGFQVIGSEGAERLIDVFATAMTLRAKVQDLFQLDLAFTPPISTPIDPVMYTGMALTNAIKKTPLITPEQLHEMIKADETFTILDVRDVKHYIESHIVHAINIPLDNLRTELEQLNKDEKVVVYSDIGENGYIAQEILLNNGFKEVYNLTGGIDSYRTLYQDRLVN